jgi:hypothetical protein
MDDTFPTDAVVVGDSTEDYTNSTVYDPGQPEGQAERIAEENAAKASSYPILGEIHQWFDAQIADCPNITNIVTDAMTVNGATYTREVSIEAQVLAFQLLQKLLEEKRDEFKEYRFEAE